MKAAEAGARVRALSEKLDALDRRQIADPRLRANWAVRYLLDEIDKARSEVFRSALLDPGDVSALAAAVFEALDIICTDDRAVAGRHRRAVLEIRAALARLALGAAHIADDASGSRLAEHCGLDTVSLLRSATGVGAGA